MQVARVNILRVVLTCLMLFVCIRDAAAEEISLLQGDVLKGRISVLERDSMRFIALEEVFSSLGFAPANVSGGLVATFSGRKIEFWSGSNISRVNGVVYALPSVVFTEGKHWWGEANSSIRAFSQFLASLSRPSDLKLTTASLESMQSQGGTVPSAPQIPLKSEKSTVSQTEPQRSLIPITGIRWGEQSQAYRVVIDIAKHTEVSLKEFPDRLEISFAGASVSKLNSTSPWPPLSMTSRQGSDSGVLIFKHNAKNVKSFWVVDPSRYVVDFYIKGNSDSEPVQPQQNTAQVKPAEPYTPPEPLTGGKKYLVVVDAGHGGKDPGASGNALKEKDIVLKAALELASKLKNLGLEVKLTRDTDVYLKLSERTTSANNSKADVFISLHCNALPAGKRASGMELYLMAEPSDKDALNLAIQENREIAGDNHNSGEVLATADKKTKLLLKILGDMQQNDKISESTTLAENLYGRSKALGFSIRKVRQAPFFVLRGAGMPAVLVEMGYITDPGEARQLNSAEYRQKMMDALAGGVLDYLKKSKGDG